MNTTFTAQFLLFVVGMLCFTTSPLKAITTDEDLSLIYQNLISAIGDKTSPFPELRRVQTAELVAGYSKRSNSIVIEEKALQVCETFGDRKNSAIAFLLAHELTHFYQKHTWEEANFGFLLKKESFEKDVEQEREADTYGAFILHLARYKIDIIPKVIPELYKAYGLISQKLEGYPSLTERQAVANQVCKKVGNLIHIFETANYMYATGQFGQAAMSYEYLLNFVQCKELYANLGATCIAAASTSASEKGNQSFIYPIAIDANFPIRDASDYERAELIQKAIKSLEKAVSYDPTYYAAFINLASAYDLAKSYPKATKLLNQLQSFIQQRDQIAEVQILRGILAAHQGQTNDASNFFDLAAKSKANAGVKDIAKKNKKILQGKAYKVQVAATKTAAEQIQIDGIELKYEPDISFEEIATLRTSNFRKYELSWKILPNSSISLYEGSQRWALSLVSTPNIRTPSGIQIGSTVEQIKAAYGEPDRSLLRNDGYTMVYFGKKLLFTIDASERVAEWGTFAMY